MRSTDQLGEWGEDVAVQHLRAAGFAILDRNWRCRDGELDVVAREGDALVFVEVKTRSGRRFGSPAEAVSAAKVRKLRLLAARWLAGHPGGGADLRFDVIGILREPGASPHVTHLRGAF